MVGKMNIILCYLLFHLNINTAIGFNILALIPYRGKSHFTVLKPYLEELAKRGHNLTVVSHFPRENPLEKYNDIIISKSSEPITNAFTVSNQLGVQLKTLYYLSTTGMGDCELLLSNKDVQNLWKNKVKFDVVLTELFNSDCSLGVAYKLDAPVVTLATHSLLPWHYKRFGIANNPAYVLHQLAGGGYEPSLYDRIERAAINVVSAIVFAYVDMREQKTLSLYLDDVPPLDELARNIKLALVYQHPLLCGHSILPTNIIQVGGFHVPQSKELKDDLKKFIEEAKHGVIYISFGSMLKASSTPLDKVEAIIGALSELPQRVVWKWDEKSLPGNPKNIYLSSWLPQNDLLAHPNVLPFYSHCGMLSITEAVHHGVPIIGMPVFGDQPGNAAAVEESGLGVQIQVKELTKERLLQKIKTVLDPEFRNRVKMLSRAWHDRPLSAMDSAIYWTEYAARYSNFTFRVRAADVPFYQYLYLDIIFAFGGFIAVILLCSKVLFSILVEKSSQKKAISTKKTN